MPVSAARPPLLQLGAAFAAGCIVTAVVAWTLRPTRAAEPRQDAESLRALAADVAGLHDSLRELTRSRPQETAPLAESAAATTSVDRDPVIASDPAETAKILARLDDLERLLVSRAASATQRTAIDPAEISDLARRIPTNANAVRAACADQERMGEELRLWSMPEVLRHFGRPNNVWQKSDGKIGFHYAEGDQEVGLWFTDGLVTLVTW